MSRNKFIAVFLSASIVIGITIFFYIGQLTNTVSQNLMVSVTEISNHDVRSFEASLDNFYAMLGATENRIELSDSTTTKQLREDLHREAEASNVFDAFYMIDSEGYLYSSTYTILDPKAHDYDEMLAFDDRFVMVYDESNGKLETTLESIILGISIPELTVGDRTFVGILGRADMDVIRSQLLIESYGGRGVSSVVNVYGYYIVSENPASEVSSRSNFFNELYSGTITTKDMDIDSVRQGMEEGRRFSIDWTSKDGTRFVLSFAPVKNTRWSFVMSVPYSVFEEEYMPFVTMTTIMLIVVLLVLMTMMLIIYQFIKQTILARAEAQARSEFLSNMSHEIRTPLNSIIGLNYLMEEHIDNEKAVKEYISKMRSAANYLLALVNDILDVSKLQASKIDLVEEAFDILSVIDDVCIMNQESINAKDISLQVNTNRVSRSHLIGDKMRISQVLMNILSNAVKFTPQGGSITIDASQSVKTENEIETKISITDTGCGISSEFQKHIFDQFTQERNVISDSQKGTGLGMSISYMLMKLMGGDLRVKSKLAKGSCFTIEFTLPSVQQNDSSVSAYYEKAISSSEFAASDHKEASADNANTRHNLDGLNILVAEDNELNASIVEQILESKGAKVTIARNGEEAIKAFDESPIGHFDAILMDGQMPKIDGYEATKVIRALARKDASSVKIFACTASAIEEDRKMAKHVGMNDFIAKPIDVKIVMEKLSSIDR